MNLKLKRILCIIFVFALSFNVGESFVYAENKNDEELTLGSFNVEDWDIIFEGSDVARINSFKGSDASNIYLPGAYQFEGESSPRRLVMSSWKNIENLKNKTKKIVIEETYNQKFLVESNHWGTHSASPSNGNTFFGTAASTSANSTTEYADLRGLETSHVTDMTSHFRYATALTYLNVDGWNTENVLDLTGTFTLMENIEKLDLSSFHTPKVKSISWLVAYNHNLKELYMPNFTTDSLSSSNPSGVSPAIMIFYDTPNLKYLDIRNLKFEGITDFRWSLEELTNQNKYIISESPLVINQNYSSLNISVFDNTTFDANQGTFSDSTTLKQAQHKIVNSVSEALAYEAFIQSMIDTPPTRVGYEFDGWSPALNNSTLIQDTLGQNYTATWKDAIYEVDFDTDEGSEVGSQSIKHNDTAVRPADPVKDHYSFDNWYQEDLETIYNFGTPIIKDTTIYAKWNPANYKVTFDTDGGTPIGDSTVAYKSKITKPANPSKLNHTFDDWYINDEFKIKWDFSKNVVEGDMTLYAKWDKVSFPVNFNTNGGSSIESQSVKYEDLVVKPQDPVRNGYTFDAWYKDNLLVTKWNFATDTIKEETTLYANWNKKSYPVTFDTDGGSAVTTQTIAYEGLVTEPTDPTKDGHTFDGWYKEATFTNKWNFTTDTVKDDTTLYAKWNKKSYPVTFNSNGGTSVSAQTIAYEGLVTEPADPTKDGHTFEGWYKEATFTNKWNFATDTVKEETTLYANWNKKSYPVTFNTDGGSSVTAQNITYEGLVTEPTDPTKDGHTFDGWYKEAALTNKWNFATDTVKDDTTLYAKWNKKSYPVTFNSNGGTSVSAQNIAYEGLVTEPADPTKDGHTFEGWYKEATFTNKWNFATDTVKDDTTVYAKWNKKSYSVTFNTDGGTAVATQTIAYEGLVTEPTDPTKDGHTFDGWYKESTFTNKWNFTTDTVKDDTTLYAKWNKQSYPVTFNSNGGSSITAQNITYEGLVTEPTDPTKDGHTFNGWYKEATFTNKWNFSTDTVKDDTTLYAKWKLDNVVVIKHTVSFDTNGGTPSLASVTVQDGEQLSEPITIVQEGYDFLEWQVDGIAYDFSSPVKSDLILKAVWKIKSHTIKYYDENGELIGEKELEYGSKIEKPETPSREHYSFGGWFTDSAYTNIWDFESDFVIDDLELYVKWNPNPYRIEFNTNNDSDSKTIIVLYNELIPEPATPSRSGYVFEGWFKDETLSVRWNFEKDKVDGPLTLHAKWTKLKGTDPIEEDIDDTKPEGDKETVNTGINSNLIYYSNIVLLAVLLITLLFNQKKKYN